MSQGDDYSFPYNFTTENQIFSNDTSTLTSLNTSFYNNVTNYPTATNVPDQPHLAQVIGVSIVVGFISIITMAGNLLVIIAFKIDKQLQTISNCFLLSLAVADFTIGLVSMPLYTVYLLMGHWPLGPALCDLWLSLDYTMSNASVANLLIICFDRYFSVTRPLTYRAHRTPKKAGIMIGCAWAVSVLLWTPWIFGWPYIEGKRTVPDTECYIQFLTTNAILTIATALAAFYIPVSVMTILYFKIYKETEKRQKRIPMLQANAKISLKHKRCRNSSLSNNIRPSSLSGNGDISLDEDEELRELPFRKTKETRTRWSTLFCCNRILDRDYEQTDNSSTSDSPTSASLKCPRVKHVEEMYDQEDDSLINHRGNKTEPPLKPSSLESHPSVSLMKGPEIRPNNNVIVNDPLLKDDLTYTILIKLPSEVQNAGSEKPSIKMLYSQSGSANSLDNENVIQKDELTNSDSEVAQLCLNGTRRKSTQDVVNYDEDDYPSEDEVSIDTKRHHMDSSVPPRCGTPALGRRAKSADAAKAATEAHIASKVVNKIENQRVRRKRQERRQDRKAAKTLSAILLAFIITWTPYNIFAVVGSFCLTCIHPTVYAFGMLFYSFKVTYRRLNATLVSCI